MDIIGSLASTDIIDLYFVLSDLVDIPLSKEEITATACRDALCSSVVASYSERQLRDALNRQGRKGRKVGRTICNIVKMQTGTQELHSHGGLNVPAPQVSSLPLNSYGGVDREAYNADPGNKTPLGKLVL